MPFQCFEQIRSINLRFFTHSLNDIRHPVVTSDHTISIGHAAIDMKQRLSPEVGFPSETDRKARCGDSLPSPATTLSRTMQLTAATMLVAIGSAPAKHDSLTFSSVLLVSNRSGVGTMVSHTLRFGVAQPAAMRKMQGLPHRVGRSYYPRISSVPPAMIAHVMPMARAAGVGVLNRPRRRREYMFPTYCSFSQIPR